MSEATIQSIVRRPILSRSRNSHVSWSAVAAAIEVVAVAAGAYGAVAGYSLFVTKAISSGADYGWASVAVAVIYSGLCFADNQYNLMGPQWIEHNRSRGLAAVAAAFIVLLTFAFVTETIGKYSRGVFVTQLVITLLVQFVTRSILLGIVDQARKRGNWGSAGMVIVTLPGANWIGNVEDGLLTPHEEIIRTYKLSSGIQDPPFLDEFDANINQIQRECRMLSVDVILVVFDKDNMDLVTRIVSAFSVLPVRIQLLPVGIADFMRKSRMGQCGRARVLEVFCRPCSFRYRLLKRALDIAVAITVGVSALPLLLIVSILIKLDSRGPILFCQMRHGFNNEPIRVFKFRTMTTFDDRRESFRQAVRGDLRVTRVGRILRRTNVDELPQLINVLKGDMSIVGPRPHAVAHNDMYAHQIDRMSRRHNVKPGITGWAQVNGLRGETDTIEKMRKRVEYDFYYIDNWSLGLDIKIMIMTIFSKNVYAAAY